MTRCGRVSGHQLRTRKCPPYIPMAKARGSTADSVDDYRNRNDGKKREAPQRCGHVHVRHQHDDPQQQEEAGQHLVLDHVHDKGSHEKAYACDSAGNEYIEHLSFLLSVFFIVPFSSPGGDARILPVPTGSVFWSSSQGGASPLSFYTTKSVDAC